MPKSKKTHERFVTEMKEINPNIEILGRYVNSHTKVKLKCKIDQYEWSATPSNLLRGYGCPKCAIAIRTKTHDQFVSEIKTIHPNIEILTEYMGAMKKVKCRCLVDGHEWEAEARVLLSKQGCPVCSGAKKTHEKFVSEMAVIHPDIEVLSQYINANTKVKCRCLIDNYEWEATPNHLLNGTKCPRCSNQEIISHEQFIKELYNINPNIEVLGQYINKHTKITMRCKIDNCEWETTPHHLLKGTGCPKCSGVQKKTHAEFVSEVLCINPNIEVVDEYVNSHTKIKFHCKIDGYEWIAEPSNILSGSGCPECHSSRGEQAIINFLKKNNIKFEEQKKFDGCKNKRCLPFDFYLPDFNICIEYQGEQHYRSVDYFGGQDGYKYRQNNDNIKRKFCKDNGIELIEINYNSLNNVDKILKGILQ